MTFFDAVPFDRCDKPESVLAMEGNGRRGREVGKEGEPDRCRGGLGLEAPFEARGEETCGLTEAGLKEEGPADMVITANDDDMRVLAFGMPFLRSHVALTHFSAE